MPNAPDVVHKVRKTCAWAIKFHLLCTKHKPFSLTNVTTMLKTKNKQKTNRDEALFQQFNSRSGVGFVCLYWWERFQLKECAFLPLNSSGSSTFTPIRASRETTFAQRRGLPGLGGISTKVCALHWMQTEHWYLLSVVWYVSCICFHGIELNFDCQGERLLIWHRTKKSIHKTVSDPHLSSVRMMRG